MTAQPSELKHMHEKLNYFYPQTYLNSWAAGVREDWAEFLHRVFIGIIPQILDGKYASLDGTVISPMLETSDQTQHEGMIETSERDGPVVIDLGAGPSICNIISASLWSSSIYLTDLLGGNRRELEKFWKNEEDVWNWKPYWNFHGVLELNPKVEQIEERTREAIKGIFMCDLTMDQVFPNVKGLMADVMICSLVFDVVATDETMLEDAMEKAWRFIRPGGLMLVQGSLGEYQYTVGSACIPVLNIDEENLRKVFEKLNLDILKWETTVRCSTHYFCVLKKKD